MHSMKSNIELFGFQSSSLTHNKPNHNKLCILREIMLLKAYATRLFEWFFHHMNWGQAKYIRGWHETYRSNNSLTDCMMGIGKEVGRTIWVVRDENRNRTWGRQLHENHFWGQLSRSIMKYLFTKTRPNKKSYWLLASRGHGTLAP